MKKLIILSALLLAACEIHPAASAKKSIEKNDITIAKIDEMHPRIEMGNTVIRFDKVILTDIDTGCEYIFLTYQRAFHIRYGSDGKPKCNSGATE